MTSQKVIALSNTNLFKPIKLGDLNLAHRVVHSPTSRTRSAKGFIPTDIMLKYYELRSQYPGTLIIFESTLVSPGSGLLPFKSGLWTDQQLAGLKQITDAIHKNGSFVSCQLCAPGRVSSLDTLKEEGLPLVGVTKGLYHSADHKFKAIEYQNELQELSMDDIRQIQDDYVNAAFNAISKAGFDLVEIHGTSGFLVEQFLSPLSNQRTDAYGGTVENRTRFVLELIDKLFKHPSIGPSKVGIRITPWSNHNGMNYKDEHLKDGHPAIEFCEYLLREIEKRKQVDKEIAYVSITEPRVSGPHDVTPSEYQTNQTLLDLFSGTIIRAGGYATKYKDAISIKSNAGMVKVEDGKLNHYNNLIKDVQSDDRTLIGFSRPFTSNPDLVFKLETGQDLDFYNRKYFYTRAVRGYLVNEPCDGSIIDAELDKEGVALT